MARKLVTTLKAVCAECGEVYERDAERVAGRCDDCRPEQDKISRDNREYQQVNRKAPRRNGYDARWDRLSRRARDLQPFCSDCGRVDDLTCDHSPEAWKRKAAGKVIRLQDVDVVCRACNAERGAARGSGADSYWQRRNRSGEWLQPQPESSSTLGG